MEKILFADIDGTLIETKSGKTFPINYNSCNYLYAKQNINENY